MSACFSLAIIIFKLFIFFVESFGSDCVIVTVVGRTIWGGGKGGEREGVREG